MSSNYSSGFTPRAAYEIRHLSIRAKTRVVRAIKALLDDPFPTGAFVLDETRDIFRLRVNNHRVVYQVREASSLVVILYIQEWPAIGRG